LQERFAGAQIALTSNYLRVQLASAREPNRLMDLSVELTTNNELRESSHGIKAEPLYNIAS